MNHRKRRERLVVGIPERCRFKFTDVITNSGNLYSILRITHRFRLIHVTPVSRNSKFRQRGTRFHWLPVACRAPPSPPRYRYHLVLDFTTFARKKVMSQIRNHFLKCQETEFKTDRGPQFDYRKNNQGHKIKLNCFKCNLITN